MFSNWLNIKRRYYFSGIIFSIAALPQNCPAKDPLKYVDTIDRRKIVISDFSQQTTGKTFSKIQFKKILAEASKQLYAKAYKYLGEEKDFFHGHVLYPVDSYPSDDIMRKRVKPGTAPISILWHTQESAGDGLMEYVDKHARNWLQSIPQPADVQNACLFQKDRSTEYPCGNDAFTLFPNEISIRGQDVDEGQDAQEINFARVNCSQVNETPHNNVFILDQSNEKLCLVVVGYYCFPDQPEKAKACLKEMTR